MLRILGNSADLREGREARGQLLVGGDGVGHGAVVEGFVGVEIEIARAGQSEEYRLFLSAFLFEMAAEHSYYAIPARVLAGLGAICFTLFSIVSILESGTSSK